MTFSGLISGTLPHHGKYHSREGRTVEYMIDHHWAGTAGGDARLADPNAQASANYVVYSDGRIFGQVPEEFRAWTSGSWEADSRAITVEVQNSSGSPLWEVSDEAVAALVALTADVAVRYGWGGVGASRVRGHREFAATACPGPYLYPLLPAIAAAASGKPMIAPVGAEDEDDMPDSMFAVVDGVPSWCWLNWANGRVFAVHTQEEANWVGGYMGSVKFDWGKDKLGSAKYKNKLALFGMLAPKVEIVPGVLTDADLSRLTAQVQAGVKGALDGVTFTATA